MRVQQDTMPCTTVIGVTRASHLGKIIEKPTAQMVTMAAPESRETRYVVLRAAPGQVDAVTTALRSALQKLGKN